MSDQVSRVVQVEPEFATRFIGRTFAEGSMVCGPADPVELDGWTDTAIGAGGSIFEEVDGNLYPIFDPEPVVELSAGRSSDEVILDLHADWSMKRIVLRRTGDAGSILFTSIEVLAGEKRKLESQIEDAKQAREPAEAECARLSEQLKLAQAREFGTSSEQKLQLPSSDMEENSPAANAEDAEPKKKPRLAASGGVRKPLSTHLPREDVRYELQPHERKCQACSSELIELSPTITEEMYTIPKRHVVRRHAQANYHCRCRCCNRFTTAPMPRRMFPGSSYGSPEFVADVATSKYQFGKLTWPQRTVCHSIGRP